MPLTLFGRIVSNNWEALFRVRVATSAAHDFEFRNQSTAYLSAKSSANNLAGSEGGHFALFGRLKKDLTVSSRGISRIIKNIRPEPYFD